MFYHFSIKTDAKNAPVSTNEHQIAFFESHFTELKYGGASGTKLEWMVGGVSKWNTELVADEWHNVAYEIDFDAGSVAFHHSTGSAALTKAAGPFSASTSSNGADWHLGVLRLPQGGSSTTAEDWYFSGVYVESGDLTTAVGSGAVAGGQPVKTSAAAAAMTSIFSTSAAGAETPKASPTTFATVKTSAAPSSAPPAKSTVAAEPPKPSSVAPVVETPAAPSVPAATKPSVAAPKPTPSAAGSGSGSGSDARLPEEFTIREFVAWLKARTGKD